MCTPTNQPLAATELIIQPVQTFCPFYRTKSSIVVCTTARHLPLPVTQTLNSTPSGITFKIHFNIILQSMQGPTNNLFRSDFPIKTLYEFLLPIRTTCPAHLILFNIITRKISGATWWLWSCSLCSFLQSPVIYLPVHPKHLPQRPIPQHRHPVFFSWTHKRTACWTTHCTGAEGRS